MDEVVSGALQRLRAADVIRMAGLAIASLGQEYSRVGAVRAAARRGAQLSGVVDLSHARGAAGIAGYDEQEALRYSVDVELLDANTWIVDCSCTPGSSAVCAHAAALLYEWLARSSAFGVPGVSQLNNRERGRAAELLEAPEHSDSPGGKTPRQRETRRSLPASQGAEPLGDLADILGQMGLSELRGLAREYDIATTSLTKQQLFEAIKAALGTPDTVRKVAASLEKPLGQLLATVILAGGTVTDEDLHGLFERFGFAQSGKLQNALMALQSKGLLLRTSLNSSSQQRIGLSGSLIDIGWYVPTEVRTVLRVPLPVTPFDIHAARSETLEIRRGEPYALLADLLLVARALAGYRLEESEEKEPRRAPYTAFPARPTGSAGAPEMTIIPPPAGYPTAAMIDSLAAILPRSPDFLRYTVRLLRLGDILYKDDKDDSETPGLRVLPDSARLLLGPARAEIARDLFALWLTQPGYDELFELQEERLRLCCRTTLTNYPLLRGSELEEENSEARQILLACIAQAPVNQWIQFPAFARFIYRLNPLFLQKRQRLFPAPHWWIEQEEGRPLQPTQMSDWMRAEGQYLERLLRGPLHWWGMADLALAPQGRVLAFRLTPLAGLFLNGTEPLRQEREQESWQTSPLAQSDTRVGATLAVAAPPVAPSPTDALAIAAPPTDAPPTDALAIAPLAVTPPIALGEQDALLVPASAAAWPFIERIEVFAEAAGVENGRLCYRLTPSALAGALGRGQDPSALLTLLRERAAAQPETARALERLLEQIAQWIASYGRVRLYSGVSLLQIADAAVMRELAVTTSVEQQIVRSITPTLVILKKQSAERLTEEIKRRGQSPLLHEEEYDGAE